MERLGVPAGQELLAQETEGSALYAMTQNSKCNGRIPCPSDSNNKEETRRKWDSSCIVAPPSAPLQNDSNNHYYYYYYSSSYSEPLPLHLRAPLALALVCPDSHPYLLAVAV